MIAPSGSGEQGQPRLLQANRSGPLPGLDPAECAREQIHIPGAIQPHGALIMALADGGLISHASANLADIIGRSAASVLGTPLASVLGTSFCEALAELTTAAGTTVENLHVLPPPSGRSLNLRAHRSGRYICVDLQPVVHEFAQQPPFAMVKLVLDLFRNAPTEEALCRSVVLGLRTIAGYDRVMCYRFGRDGQGEVIAENNAAGLEPYLGNHYPTTDIPAQARRQLLKQRVGAIADSAYEPVAILADERLDDRQPLDLTHSSLRSVSPIHREFMRNMGTAASLSIGLARGQELWGVLICHHATPRIAGPTLRSVADIIGEIASQLLDSLGRSQLLAQRADRTATLNALVIGLSTPVPLADALASTEDALLRLVNASGVALRMSGTFFQLGKAPPLNVVKRLFAVLQPQVSPSTDTPRPNTPGPIVAIDDLGLRYPELADSAQVCSGALLLQLTADTDDAIIWFRPELSRIITWAGDPNRHNAVDPLTGRLSARSSFAAWHQTEQGRSASWTAGDQSLALEFRSAIGAELAQRARVELRHYQGLTGRLEEKVRTRTLALADEAGRRKSAEDTLQQAQKMDAIGQLTSGVAHDFNNVLGAIMSNIELAEGGVLDQKARRHLQSAQQAAERGATLTGHLLAFARQQPMRRGAYDLRRLAEAFKDIVTRSIGSGVMLSMELPAEVWAVAVDATQFEMALLNLALNATQAMPDGGSLVIAAANQHAGSPRLPGDLVLGDYVCVSVRDTGAGMSAGIVARAFEPFFTTKEMGKGTGLGLSQVYGFSKQSDGTARLSSSPGSGTLVEMWLPRSFAGAQVSPMPAGLKVVPQSYKALQQNRVLVVDDDPLMLEATGEVLRNLGYEVIEADSALRGLEIMSDKPTLNMLVTDFSMPKMNGVEFIRMVRRDHPTMPCLLMTGYADSGSVADAVAGGVPILRKPFHIKDLAESMDRLRLN